MIRFSVAKEKPGHDESSRPWYDTRAGITRSLNSLSEMKRMLSERHTAGYDRGERLNEFYILGRYSLDTCGNCMKAEDFVPKEVYPEIPDVLTRDEFWAFIKERSEGDGPMISFSMGSGIPDAGLLCPHCHRGWDVANCHDTVVRNSHEVILLANFTGLTLREVKESYLRRYDALFRLQPESFLRNDRFIDPSPRYPNPDSDWLKGQVKNERGWVGKEDGITDDYIIQPWDEAIFNVWKYYHRECHAEHLAAEEEKSFREIFEKAGFQKIQLTAIPNKYCPCEMCAPWFEVETEIGTFVIGWRKRVIDIEWGNILVKPEKDILSLFSGENVTKASDHIHAWGPGKAREYLIRIRNLLEE